MNSLVIVGCCFSKFWLESYIQVNYLNPIGQFQTEDLSVTTQHPTTFSESCPPIHTLDTYDCLKLLKAEVFYPLPSFETKMLSLAISDITCVLR
jgi:hypothetical protein